MRRIFIFASFLVASFGLADSFLFVQAGKITSGPRELPSVGVRLDNGQPVLGLHGADDATRAACGWYRVIPTNAILASNQMIVARSYLLNKDTAQEVVVISNFTARVFTPRDRITQMFDELPPAMGNDARCAAIIKAIAQTITNKMGTSVTVTIPAAQREALK
ncbi:MAG: hypothetical protein ACOYOU_00815 [Kiritimatiellia bacterium]